MPGGEAEVAQANVRAGPAADEHGRAADGEALRAVRPLVVQHRAVTAGGAAVRDAASLRAHDNVSKRAWRNRSCFLPWTQWRFVRHSYYDLQGEHIATLPKREPGLDGFRLDQEIKKTVPIRKFNFLDFDGEPITATTLIEEREWLFGTGWFQWLSWFRKPKISRSLDLQFSSEVGKRKGSWKGGTLGHGIEMLPGELHEAAFRRYCDQNELTFK